MAAQKGFIYEENTADFLKPAGIVPQNFMPAGAGHDQPDLMIQFKGQEAGLELKINQASFGSLVLHFYREQQLKGNNPWSWGSIGPDEKEKLFLQDLGTRLKVLDEIKKNWTKTPHLIQDRQKMWNTPAMKKSILNLDLEVGMDLIRKTLKTSGLILVLEKLRLL